MNAVTIFEGITVLTLLVYFVPLRFKQPLCLVLSLGLALVTTTWAVESFTGGVGKQHLSMPFWFHNSVLVIDKLSAFFLIVINFGTLTSILFSRGYMKMYETTKRSQDFSLHYFFLLWLQIAMTLVVTLQEGLPFLVAWEIMSLSSFMLVIFESEKKEILHQKL